MAKLIQRNDEIVLELDRPAERFSLARVGQFTHLRPVIDGLDQVFYTIRHVPGDFSGDVVVVRVREPLVWEFEDPFGKKYQRCFAGLEPLLLELLTLAGVAVELKGDRPAPLAPPELECLEGLTPPDVGVLEFVGDRDRGLIRTHGAGKVMPARVIAQIVRAYPTLRVVVAVTRIDDGRRLARSLARYGVEAPLHSSRHPGSPGGRVVVGAYSHLAGGAVGLRRRNLYLALNPAELFQGGDVNWVFEGLKHLHRGRLFGLLADDARLAPWLRDQMTALFGVEEIHVPRHGYSPLSVEVVSSPIEGGDRPRGHKEDHAIKRVGVHEHQLRNRRIVRLAQALAGSDRAALKEKFPEVAAVLDRRRGRARVGVLVDSVGHGLTLAATLGWPLVAAVEVNEQGLTPGQRLFLKKGRNDRRRTRESVVVTGAGMARAGRFDVIVRADGGTGLPAVPEAKLRVKGVGGDRRLLLVDFLDRHHPLLRKWSRQRREAYIAAGWAVAGEEKTPLERFMATRPQGVVG